MATKKAGWIEYLTAQAEYKNRKKSIRAVVFSSQKNVCVNCGTTSNLTMDHIKPLRMGGTNNLDNFQILCMECNRSKGAR